MPKSRKQHDEEEKPSLLSLGIDLASATSFNSRAASSYPTLPPATADVIALKTKQESQEVGDVFLADLSAIIVDYLRSEDKTFPKQPHKGLTLFQQVSNLYLQQAAAYVLSGNLEEAKKLVEVNPSLLLHKTTAMDYSGRKIYGTLLQMALGAEDVSRADHPDEGMAEMLLGYFKQAFAGDEKAANEAIIKQCKEQFPEGYEEKEAQRKQCDSEALKTIVKAIEDAKAVDNPGLIEECKNALEAFRDYLKPKGLISNGKHFNAQLLVEAFELCDTKYDAFGGDWDSPKNFLFWQKVVGYIQRYLPACYAQAFCQSLNDVVARNQKLTRGLSFCYGLTVVFFPLDSNSSFRLGFDYFTASGGKPAAWGWGGGGSGAKLGRFIKTYVKQKQQHCKLMQQLPDNQSTGCCILM